MAQEPPFYHDKRYQCCCGVNAERAALIIGILGIVWSLLTVSIISFIAYVCVVIAIKTKNPSLYIVFYVVAGVAVVVYILIIVLTVLWIANAYDYDDTFYIIALAFAIVELLVQFWVIWIMKRAHAYTKAVRDGGYAHHHHHHHDQHFHGHPAAYPAGYPPYNATPNAFTSPQSPPVYTGQAPYPNTIQMNAYPQPQQPAYPDKSYER